MLRLWSALLVGGLLSVPIVGIPSPVGAVPVPWENCGARTDIMQVAQVDASVWPPVVGQQITVRLSAAVTRNITGGAARLTVTPISEPWQLAAAQPVFLQLLPIKAGPYQKLVTFTVPSRIQGQGFALLFDAHDNSGAEVVCAQATIPLKGTTASPPGDFSGQLLDQQMAIAGLSELFPLIPLTNNQVFR